MGQLAISTPAQQNGLIPLLNIASTTNASLFTILGNGNVGIGTKTPYNRLSVWGPDTLASTAAFLIANSASTTEFVVNDDGSATLAGTLTQNSDQRLKTNVQPLDASTSLSLIDELNPVTFNWLSAGQSSTTQVGFIAQDVQKIFPNLVSTTSATALTPGGTLGLNYIGLIAPLVKAVQALAAEVSSIKQTITGFAQSFMSHFIHGDTVEANKLCVSKSDGSDVCITGDQLAAVVFSANQSPASASPTLSSATTTSSSTPDTLPIIQINGNNPAHVKVGASYADLGATITGPHADLNLGTKTFLNGVFVSNIVLDTTAAATDTIDYVVTDANGFTATSTRTVIIEAQALPVPSISNATPSAATSTDATTTAQ